VSRRRPVAPAATRSTVVPAAGTGAARTEPAALVPAALAGRNHDLGQEAFAHRSARNAAADVTLDIG